MSKLIKSLALAVMVAGALAMTPGPSAAQRHHGANIGHSGIRHGGIHHSGNWHGGAWRGGAWRGGAWRGYGWRGSAWGWPGPFFFGWGPYYDPYYYAGPDCSWVYVRVLRRGHWILRRAWRCW